MRALRVTCQSNTSPSRARARPAGLGEAGRPLTITVGAMQLPPTPREDPECRRKGGGHIPRLAGLGEAGRPNLAACEALPWCVRQAQLTYLRATDAQPSTDHRVV